MNMMSPPIGPIGLDYVAGAMSEAGYHADVVDMALADDPAQALQDYFGRHSPELVGISLRNVDDCFWPSAQWFAPSLVELVGKLRAMTDAPIVVGGVGFSIFAEHVLEISGADFGIRGDGEKAMVLLLKELTGAKRYERVPGLLWRQQGRLQNNPPAWGTPICLPTQRRAIDNAAYFEKGGQCGLETKRGCNRQCLYCADPLAKGSTLRLRDPVEVADEVESLLGQGIDVLHLCDAEFNVPRSHAIAVCQEFVRRSLSKHLRWYTYMAVVPFDGELASIMQKAGCVGIDFTSDSAHPQMLKTYGQQHTKEDLAHAVKLCRDKGITVMLDLLLGGPGETGETVAQTISFVKQIGPDAVGAPLGLRIYPGTPMARLLAEEGPVEANKNLRRKYDGPVDFFKPTFYVSTLLGERPAELVCDLIGQDRRFFAPVSEEAVGTEGAGESTDHNYNDNTELLKAIEKGARGAYWDILRTIRAGT